MRTTWITIPTGRGQCNARPERNGDDCHSTGTAPAAQARFRSPISKPVASTARASDIAATVPADPSTQGYAYRVLGGHGSRQLAGDLPLRGTAIPPMSTTWTTTTEVTLMPMHDPLHPGAFIRRQCLQSLGLTVTEAAKGLSVSRNRLSMPLNDCLAISPKMAILLSEAFGSSLRELVDAADEVRAPARAAEPRPDRDPQIRGSLTGLNPSLFFRNRNVAAWTCGRHPGYIVA